MNNIALKPKLRELAARSERVVEFSGGYVNTSQGVLKESGAGGHFNRNAGAYTGTLLFPGVGTVIGALIDLNRRKKNRIYTEEENPISDRTAASLARGFGKQFSARSERVVELARGDYAIPAMKRLLKKGIGNGGDPISIAEIGSSGTTVPSLRGNAANVRRALNKFWESPHSMAEAEGLMRGNRQWAAQTIRQARKDRSLA